MWSLTYPILDAFLIIPSIIIIFYSCREFPGRKARSGLLLAISMNVMATADTGFGYAAVDDIGSLGNQVTWDIQDAFSYILLLGTILMSGVASSSKMKQNCISTSH